MPIDDVKTNSILCYSLIIYIMLLTGANFYINYKIDMVSSIQTNALNMFKSYAEKDASQQKNINDINRKVQELQNDINSLDKTVNDKLIDILKLLR